VVAIQLERGFDTGFDTGFESKRFGPRDGRVGTRKARGEFSGNGERSTDNLQKCLLSYRYLLLPRKEIFLIFSAARMQQKEKEL